ncbi:radical SAM protein [Desulfuromonas sp. AOP6]|uniref:radical SAM protein n=1 Tax=Desulfuromonas sp. AOP6 TaxID=1566351 RepID=UPI0012843B07|nr:radical SAM protein [Desulfuromonas sp. AOP6]BCA80614.1 hypothetical protein AOP6_2401 [Desulfuromonas sp. AOP6]
MITEISSAGKARLVEGNRSEYGEHYDRLTFLGPAQTELASARRRELLDALAGKALVGCGGTKLDCTDLSPGCRLCAEGSWSCLFVNGRCNCDCFYCPASQDDIGLPTTNTVDFRTPADYVTYLERFGFRGASMSGGEPLLTPNRTLAFIEAIKKRFGADMHVWLYTNGTLATPDLMKRLRDAGLDEIRFDIGATGYRLDKLRLAVGHIPTVTVEIPAIAEEKILMQAKMVEMAEAGVNYLNLHQLRLTPYNFERLAPRGYTYLHGDKVTVLDSELTALELIHYGREQRIPLPVNYCSFVYKNRYQNRASRRRNAPFLTKGYEQLTESGYIRTLTLTGPSEAIARQRAQLEAVSAPCEQWSLSHNGERLSIHPALWPLIDFSGLRLLIAYATARQLPAVSYRNPFVAVKLGDRKQVIVERAKVAADFELQDEKIGRFSQTFLSSAPPFSPCFEDDLFESLARFEWIPKGLQAYF